MVMLYFGAFMLFWTSVFSDQPERAIYLSGGWIVVGLIVVVHAVQKRGERGA